MAKEWGFRPVRTKIGGVITPLLKDAPITAATVLARYELLKYTRGTGLVALGAIAADGTDALYVNAKASTASTTHTITPVYAGSEILFMVAVKEIADATVLTATGGGTTSFVDSSLVIADGAYGNNFFEGSILEVDAMVSTDKSDGDEITLTASTASSGTLTSDSLGSTGFASGDTAHLTKFGRHVFGCYSLGIEYDGSATSDGCRLQLDGTDGTSRAVRVVGWNSARTKLLVTIIASPDQAIATMDT